MAGWNGSGVFTRNYNWVADRDAGIKILASKMDTEHDTFTAGIQACLAKNGENSATANLPMGGFKHTGVANGTARDHYTAVGQMQDGSFVYGAAGGTANAQTLVLSPAVPALVAGQAFRFKPVANNTGACTLQVSGLAATSIKLCDGTDPAAKDLNTNGIAEVIYNGTVFVLINPATFTASAAATWSSKTLTSPTISNPTLTGVSQINGLAYYSMVPIAPMQNMVSATVTTSSGWSTVSYSTLTSNGAKVAMIQARLRHTNVASSATAAVYIRKTGTTPSDQDVLANQLEEYVGSSAPIGVAGVSMVLVELDGSSRFDWKCTSSPSGGNVYVDLYLMGYYK